MSEIEVKVGKIETKVDNMDRNIESLSVSMSKSMDGLHKKFDHHIEYMENKLKKEYVKKIEYIPVRNIVYGGAAIILTTVATAIVTLVVTHAS